MVRRLALALCACSLVPLFAAACGGEDAATSSVTGAGTSTPSGASTKAADTSAEPKLDAPVSRFAINVEDMGTDANTGNAAYLTDIKSTFVLDAKSYGKTSAFASAEEGERTLNGWGYLGGYETGLIPEGRDTAVLNGAFYVNVEVHLFKSPDTAKEAFRHFETKLKSAQKAQPVQSATVGNQSSAWTMTEGKVGTSNVSRVYHQIILRRGNLVAIVLTSGAEGFMKVDVVRAMAAIIDQKALGQKNAVEPTPVPTAVSATPPGAAATATKKP